MIGRGVLEPPHELLDRRSDPDTRAVLDDFRLSNGERITRLGVAFWIFDRRVDADASDDDDDADADASDDAADASDDADAAADAADADAADAADASNASAADSAAGGADADAADAAAHLKARNLLEILNGELDMKEGLKIIQLPGRYYYKVTKVGWLKRIAGDEYELIGACTVMRTSGTRHLDELASDGPKDDHRVFKPSNAAEDIHRLSILRCIQADPESWPTCPQPKNWHVEEVQLPMRHRTK